MRQNAMARNAVPRGERGRNRSIPSAATTPSAPPRPQNFSRSHPSNLDPRDQLACGNLPVATQPRHPLSLMCDRVCTTSVCEADGIAGVPPTFAASPPLHDVGLLPLAQSSTTTSMPSAPSATTQLGSSILLLAQLGAVLTAQAPCTSPQSYGSGTGGSQPTPPTLAPNGVPFLGNSAYALRGAELPPGALTGHLIGLQAAANSIAGISVLVDAPIVTLGVASMQGTVAFPFPLPTNPANAGLPLFSQLVALDSGGPAGLIASPGLAHVTCTSDVTNVRILNDVKLQSVKRLGLNLGGHDRWGASKILVNQLPNPGFEPGVFGTVWLADSTATTDVFVPRDWHVTNGSHAPGFWDGADYEIVYGTGSGTSGTVQSFTHSGNDYAFALGPNGGTALAERDVLFTRRTVAGARGMHGSTGIVDTNNPFSGSQSLRLDAGENFAFVMDTSWRDGDRSSHKLLVVEGPWRIRLAARAANAGDQLRVRFQRDGGPPYNPTFLSRTFTLTTSWTTVQETQTIAAGIDQTPEPWPNGVYRPALTFSIDVPASNTGPIWIDEVELYRVDEASNPTAFNDRFVQRLQDYQPGVLRWWSGQLGDTLENMTRSWRERGTCGYRPDSSAPDSWGYGAVEFLQLCQHLGAEPWIVLPPTASQTDLLGFVAYLAATSGPWATRRVSQGQAAPWTSVFPTIHLEWGNELWGSGTPSDPFGGASVNGGVRLGALADRAFEIVKSSPHYAANANRLNLVIGGQAGYSGRQQEIEANANDHNSVALGPYFGRLDQFATEAEIYGPLFANATYQGRTPNGAMQQSKQHLLNGGNGTALSIYEINFHTTQQVAGLPSSVRNEFVAGASGAVALPLAMLVYMTELGVRDQCAFTAIGYSYRFDSSGGWPPQQDQFVQVWGLLRDLYHYNLRRPTWLGVELANRAIIGDVITTVQTGADPTWLQPAINGIGTATTVHKVQSFAFRDGNDYGLILMNLDLNDPQVVRLDLPSTPQASASLHAIEPANLGDINATSEVVTLTTTQLGDFADGYQMILPAHSIRAVRWRN